MSVFVLSVCPVLTPDPFPTLESLDVDMGFNLPPLLAEEKDEVPRARRQVHYSNHPDPFHLPNLSFRSSWKQKCAQRLELYCCSQPAQGLQLKINSVIVFFHENMK